MKKQMVKGDVLILAVTLAVCSMAVTPVWAANSGGNADSPETGDYSGGSDTQNQVVIDSDVTNNVYGGYDSTNQVERNTVTVADNAEIGGMVCGGFSSGAIVSANTVTVNSGTIENDFIYGGYSENNSAQGNKVFIKDGTLLGVYGGHSDQANVFGNEVTVEGGSTYVAADVVGGHSEGEGNVYSNKINVSVGTIDDSLYGGYSEGGTVSGNQVEVSGSAAVTNDAFGGVVVNNGDVTGNKVIISGGTVKNVYGGEFWNDEDSGSSKVSGNIVEITGGKITGSNKTSGNVYGGHSAKGDVAGNEVSVSGANTQIKKDVDGGYTKIGQAQGNILNISSGKIGGYVFSGRSDSGEASGNIANVTGGTVSGYLYGGFSSSTAQGNTVSISNGDLTCVYGGYSKVANAVENNVTFSGGTVFFDIIGGESAEGSTFRNKVTFEGNSSTVANIYGGKSKETAVENTVTVSGRTSKDVYGGLSTGNSVTGNIVNINDGIIKGSVYGGRGSGESVSNKVTIAQGDIKGDIFGGYSKDAEAVNNAVEIKDGTVAKGHSVYGGYSETKDVSGNKVSISGGTLTGGLMDCVYGGNSKNGASTDNKVTISGGNVTKLVYGGYSSNNNVSGNEVVITGDANVSKFVYGGASGQGTAVGNIVTVNGGTLSNVIYGGYTFEEGSAAGNIVNISGGTLSNMICGGYANKSAATGNIVNISGAPVFDAAETVIFGGYSNAVDKDVRTGNTLNVYTKGLTAANVKNFAEYNFYLPADVAGGEAVLTLKDSAGTDISGSSVKIGIQGSAEVLRADQKITLLQNDNGIQADGVQYSGQMFQGVSLEYGFVAGLNAAGTAVVTEIKACKVKEQSRSPVETQAVAVAFINSGADLLAGQGISNAIALAQANGQDIFGAMSGGSMRYKTGSYADVHGYNLALGLGKAVTNNAGTLSFGPFAEYGWGNYTSHLDSGIRGDGNTKYYGIGMLAHQDNTDGSYYEGSLRYGRMDADYASGDLKAASGNVYGSYDSSSYYYGAHLGIGKINKLNDTVKSDVYAKLIYTRPGGDSVTLQGAGNGEVYDFDAADSIRARIGARLSKDYSQHGSGYAGLAYEYEFDGEAQATVKGLSTPAPSIKGGSGMLELGYILKAQGANDPSIEIGLQGWAGKKQGVTANLDFVWTF